MANKLLSAQNMLLLLEEHSDAQSIKISQLQLAKEKLSHSMKINSAEILQIKNQLDNEIENNKISTKQVILKKKKKKTIIYSITFYY